MTEKEKKIRKILVIDDERDVVETLALRLESFGYDVKWADSAHEGIEKAAVLKPDLIFLDFTIGEETGLEVLYQLKRDMNSVVGQIPVIMLTGRDEFEGDCLAAGAAGYITKPFDLFQLKEVLVKFLPN